jgi:hypothetical protein
MVRYERLIIIVRTVCMRPVSSVYSRGTIHLGKWQSETMAEDASKYVCC